MNLKVPIRNERMSLFRNMQRSSKSRRIVCSPSKLRNLMNLLQSMLKYSKRQNSNTKMP